MSADDRLLGAERAARQVRRRRARTPAGDVAAGHFTWRALAGAPLVAVVLVIAALIACDHAGIAFRDPDNVAAQYVVLVGAGVAAGTASAYAVVAHAFVLVPTTILGLLIFWSFGLSFRRVSRQADAEEGAIAS